MSSKINVDYINEVLNETVDDDDKQNLPDDWEEGLTFTARSSRKYTDISFCPPPPNELCCMWWFVIIVCAIFIISFLLSK